MRYDNGPIKVASSIVVFIITKVVTFPLWVSTHFSAFAKAAESCVDISTTTVTTIKVAFNIVCFIITKAVSNHWMSNISSTTSLYMVTETLSAIICNDIISTTIPTIKKTVFIICVIITVAISNCPRSNIQASYVGYQNEYFYLLLYYIHFQPPPKY